MVARVFRVVLPLRHEQPVEQVGIGHEVEKLAADRDPGDAAVSLRDILHRLHRAAQEGEQMADDRQSARSGRNALSGSCGQGFLASRRVCRHFLLVGPVVVVAGRWCGAADFTRNAHGIQRRCRP